MGLLDAIFKKPKLNEQSLKGYFKMLSGYTPAFYTYDGGIYEMEITRAAIHSFANHCSKLKPEVVGSAYKSLAKMLEFKMNPFMDTTKFLYRTATILSVDNTAFIVPLTDDTGERITGFFPIRPSRSELLEDKSGRPWLKYYFSNGQTAIIEWDRVGVVAQYLFSKDFFGEDNTALDPTMQLINTNSQGIIEGVKQSATIRFMARLANVYKPEDITKERLRFTTENLSAENNSGVMMFDAKYADIKQIESKPFTVDADQMKVIQSNVFNYFGTNEEILQNKFKEEVWNSFYEGKIEPFAIQLSLVLSNMLFSDRELAQGNKIIFSSNRLQYASNTTKLSVVTQLFDRGFLTHNQGLEIFNLPTLGEEGDKRYIRLEYGDPKEKEVNNNASSGQQGVQGDNTSVSNPDGEEKD
jgi:hypothetical protein